MNPTALKLCILGAGGYLGSSAVSYFRAQGHTVFDDRIEVSDFSALRSAFANQKPDVVINLTGPAANPTIDWCEDHKEESVKMLVVAPVNVVLAAIECGAYPIQISSGCIYSGGPEQEFTEEDAPNFFGSFYSRMRIASEQVLRELPVLTARIRMPLSSTPHPRNFITKIAAYKKVISIPNSVTVLEDLWPGLLTLIEKRVTGVVNMTNEGFIEHRAVLGAYRRIVDAAHTYEPISLEELQGPGGITKSKRSNCILSALKQKSLGVRMPALDEGSLEALLREYKKHLRLS